mmetsp:Transcript_32402/g.82282  ORF Transcript_32402/g.82282 Transcript_32402/m.82282 type:complete len:209 (+) Transcript_32402:814-1440(+)
MTQFTPRLGGLMHTRSLRTNALPGCLGPCLEISREAGRRRRRGVAAATQPDTCPPACNGTLASSSSQAARLLVSPCAACTVQAAVGCTTPEAANPLGGAPGFTPAAAAACLAAASTCAWSAASPRSRSTCMKATPASPRPTTSSPPMVRPSPTTLCSGTSLRAALMRAHTAEKGLSMPSSEPRRGCSPQPLSARYSTLEVSWYRGPGQ